MNVWLANVCAFFSGPFSTHLCSVSLSVVLPQYVVSTVTSQIVKISPSGQMDVLAESHHGVYSSTDGYGELWGLSIVPGSPNSFVTACDDGTVCLLPIAILS